MKSDPNTLQKVGHPLAAASNLSPKRLDAAGVDVKNMSNPVETRAESAIQQNGGRECVQPSQGKRLDTAETVTAQKAAELEGADRRSINRRCQAGKYPGAVKSNMNGGPGWLIPVVALSAEAQARYRKAAQPPAPEQQTLPAIVQHEEYRTLMDAYDKKPPKLKQMAEAAAGAVDAFLALRNSGLSVGMAEKAILESHKISKPNLCRHRAAVEGHDRQYWEAILCPRYHGGRGKSDMTEEAYEAICRDFFIQSQPPLSAILPRIRKEGMARGWVIPSDKTVMNRLKAEPPHLWTWRQGGKKALERSFPTVEKEYSTLRLHEFWESDGRRADVRCVWPDGTVGRPVVVAWREVRTRMPLALGIYKNEDAELVISAFCRALTLSGTRPENAKMDNGRSFANKPLTGQQANRYRFKIKPDEPVGLMTRIGTQVKWSKPGKGRDKPIESWWNFIANHCDKLPQFEGAYCGRNPVEKPDNFDPRKAVPVEEYGAALKAAAWAFANRPHRGDGMGGESPWALYKRLSEGHTMNPVDPAMIRLGLMGVATVKPDRQTAALKFKFDGYGEVRYWSDALADQPLNIRARKLHVYYDPGRPNDPVSIYDGDKYLCDAERLGKVDFHEVGGGKVEMHMRAHAEFLRTRQAEINALKGSVAPPKGAISQGSETALLTFFDQRTITSKEPATQPPPEADTIQPHPTEPGAYIDTETGQVYRGAKVLQMKQKAEPDGEEMTDEELEALRQRQREKNMPAYLRGQP